MMKQRPPTRSLLNYLSTPESKEPSTPITSQETISKESTIQGALFTMSLPQSIKLMIDTVDSTQPDRVRLFLRAEGLKRLLGYTSVSNLEKFLSTPPHTLSVDKIRSFLPEIGYDAACEILAAVALGTRRQTRLSFLDTE